MATTWNSPLPLVGSAERDVKEHCASRPSMEHGQNAERNTQRTKWIKGFLKLTVTKCWVEYV